MSLVSPEQSQLLLTVGAVGCIGASALLSARCWQLLRHLPPGPSGLPVVGCLPLLASGDRHLRVADLCSRYGNVVSLPVGGRLFVFVNDYELVKQLLDDENFLNRATAPAIQRVTDGCGMLFSRDSVWSHNRRTTLRILRDFGFARTRSADLVDRQLDDIAEMLDSASSSGQPLRVLETFTEATNGIIASLTIGRVFTKSDPEFRWINQQLRELFEFPPFLNLSLLYPSTDWLMRRLPMTKKFEQLQTRLNQFIIRQIRAREAVVTEDTEPQCLCDALLQLKWQAEKAGDFTTYRDMQIARLNLEFFLAGTDTTARTLEWLLLYMSYNPQVQTRVQHELDSVVGRSRRPQMQDRKSLSLTCATIEETMRLVSLAGLGAPRMPKTDATFAGFKIPAGSFVFPFVFGVNHSVGLWGDPENFRPERFLDNQGRFLGNGKSVPFLLGRRSCAGESLARMEVFLIFAAVMQRYVVIVSEEFKDKKEEVLAGRQELLRIPGRYSMQFMRRR